MKKLLLITLLSLSPIVATMSINCAQTTQQAQQEEAALRWKCNEIRMAIIAQVGDEVMIGRSSYKEQILHAIATYQSEYLRSVGTPIALKLLGEMGEYGL